MGPKKAKGALGPSLAANMVLDRNLTLGFNRVFPRDKRHNGLGPKGTRHRFLGNPTDRKGGIFNSTLGATTSNFIGGSNRPRERTLEKSARNRTIFFPG